MSATYCELRALLNDLFEFDHADLDFGIYRVMNVKRAEIGRFLDTELLPQVKGILAGYGGADRARLDTELRDLEAQLRLVGVEPDASPVYRDKRDALAQLPDAAALEGEVYAALVAFFRRYYSEGDFLSLRRYKPGVYAIPYEGEEIKLHWANADQYYIKTTERFQDYRFRLPAPDERHVHFRLVQASTERDNNKSAEDEQRRFVLREHDWAHVDGDELTLSFEYAVRKEKQGPINAASVARILEDDALAAWHAGMQTPARTEKEPGRTLLAKHLNDYTAKNSRDYFIHKDLGGFLRRELDFFIKNEVIHLDDLTAETDNRALHALAKARAIKDVAGKIIAFLAQLEDFQKRLYLKKKFVTRTNWCVTLDRVPGSLYDDILANADQWAEWERLFAISALPGSDAPDAAWLRANPYLVLDTRFFDSTITDALLASFDDLDAATDGVLINADNFQALHLLGWRYAEQVKCVYIDPPYNTSSSAIPYKNDYKHSSWMTMMSDRLAALAPMLPDDGAIFVSIDKTERNGLEYVMDGVFGPDNRVEELIWSMNTNNSQAPNYSTNHEYVQVYAKNRRRAEEDRAMFREPKPGYEEVMAVVQRLNPSYPPLAVVEAEIQALYEQHKVEYRESVASMGLEWEDEKGNDPWRGLFNYSHAEYRDSSGMLVRESDAKERNAILWVYRESDTSMPATKQAASTRDPEHPNWRFYKPIHPITGKPTPIPKSGWKFAYAVDDDSPERRSFVSLARDHRIAWGRDEKKVPQLKRMLHEVETNVGKSVIQDYSDGEKQTSAMFGRSGIFLAPKHSDFVSRFIVHAAKTDSTILDCFGGSGSTAHAVINLNRTDHGNRRFVLVEMGEYFGTVLKPRVLKAVYSKDWRSGQPTTRDGISQCIKVLRLESYEDTLNNLTVTPENKQLALLPNAPVTRAAREDFALNYLLAFDTAGSASLLDVDAFARPDAYTLTITEGGESRAVAVDLAETFNYLLGLRVRTVRGVGGIRAIEGHEPDGTRALVLWRRVGEHDDEALRAFMQANGYTGRPRETALARIYVNGDSALAQHRAAGETWDVLLTEAEFKRRMFAGAD